MLIAFCGDTPWLKSVVVGVSVPIDLFFGKYDILRVVVTEMFTPLGRHRWKRVEIVMLLLRMSVYYQAKGYRQPFASAHWYACNCFCSEKTVDRLVKWLKLQGFARVRRLRRRDTEALWMKQNQKGWTNESWQKSMVELRDLSRSTQKGFTPPMKLICDRSLPK